MSRTQQRIKEHLWKKKKGVGGWREKRRNELIIYTMAKVHIPVGIQLLSHVPTYQGCFSRKSADCLCWRVEGVTARRSPDSHPKEASRPADLLINCRGRGISLYQPNKQNKPLGLNTDVLPYNEMWCREDRRKKTRPRFEKTTHYT